jgi:hypothetical protein
VKTYLTHHKAKLHNPDQQQQQQQKIEQKIEEATEKTSCKP